jgi:hypothetical protein
MDRHPWSQLTADIHALRRARGRAAYNARRQRWAGERRRMLARLLREAGFDPAGDLRGAGTEALYRRYVWETGRSRATFYRDLALLKTAGRFGSGGGGVRGGSGRRDGAGTWDTWEWEPGAPGPSPSSRCEAGFPSQSVRPRDRTAITDTAGPAGPVDPARAPGSVSGSGDVLPRLLAQLRREPCPTCGRLVGLPARTERPGPWATAYASLRLALEQQLEAGVVEALLVHAARLQAHLRPPRRLGDLPPSPRSSSRHRAEVVAPSPAPAQAQARPRLTRPSPSSSSAYAYDPPVLDAGPEPDLGPGAEVYIWRL